MNSKKAGGGLGTRLHKGNSIVMQYYYVSLSLLSLLPEGSIVLESVVFPGQHVGILPDGEPKPPDHTGRGEHGRFTPPLRVLDNDSPICGLCSWHKDLSTNGVCGVSWVSCQMETRPHWEWRAWAVHTNHYWWVWMNSLNCKDWVQYANLMIYIGKLKFGFLEAIVIKEFLVVIIACIQCIATISL